MAKKAVAAKHVGSIGWTEMEGMKQLNNVIFRSNALALDFIIDDTRYKGTLKFDGERFVGELDCVWDKANHAKVRASCRLFKNNEELPFFGSWVEQGITYKFWVNLDPDD